MGNDARQWRCERGHVLGLARRRNDHRQELLLYRVALDMTPGAEQVDVDVAAVIIGQTDVVCSVCGSIRSWFESAGRKDNHRGTETQRVEAKC